MFCATLSYPVTAQLRAYVSLIDWNYPRNLYAARTGKFTLSLSLNHREHLYGLGVYIALLKLFTRDFISILLGKKLCNVILRGNLQFFRWYLDGIFAEKDTYDV